MNQHPITDNHDADYDAEYDRVTATSPSCSTTAQLRCGPPGDDPAELAAFLHRKAELFTRIADQAGRTRTDDYLEQVRQMATNARTAAERIRPATPTAAGGAKSEEN